MEIEYVIKPITLAERVYEQLRREIIIGNYEPGQKISEVELSNKFHVSRSPIRIALSQLVNEGLLIGVTNKSNLVWDPTEKDITEILSLRMILETLASEWSINRMNSSEINSMQELIDKQEIAKNENDYSELISLDRYFHWIFVSKSNHSRLQHQWNLLMNQWEVLTYIRFKYLPSLSGTVTRDHKKILDAFDNKDVKELKQLHIEINERVKNELITTLKKYKENNKTNLILKSN